MSSENRNRGFYAVIVIIAGMLTTHALASVHIYLSNTELYWTLDALREQGYLVIPNGIVMQGLLNPGPACAAALLFTLSIGAALSSFTFAAIWVWVRLFARNKTVLIMLLLVWIGALFLSNSQGMSIIVTCYFLLVPAVTSAVALKVMPEQSVEKARVNKIVHIVSFIAVAVLCISQLGSGIFIDFRDNFFLSNPVGIKMNDFYYKYTLYAAEVIKPIDQKTIKTVSLQEIENESDLLIVKQALNNYNYLTVPQKPSINLRIVGEGNNLIFKNSGREVLRTTIFDFAKNPGSILLEYSAKTDRMAFFRTYIFLSLLSGLPLTVYLVLYSSFRLVSSFLMNSTASAVTAAIICLLIGSALVYTLESNNQGKVGINDLNDALNSERWQTRMAALKVIEKNGLEVSAYSAYENMLSSPQVAERYWLVKALGVSNRPETITDLIAFLDDSHTNVVCMAYLALSKRTDKGYAKQIIPRIEQSDHWYEQFYAYNALMELGWRQKLSN